MSMGARLVLFPKFDPDLVLKVARKRPPTFLPAVPPIYQRLLAAAEAKKVSLKGAAVSISGAMPLDASLILPWEAETGGFLVEGYGLSECAPGHRLQPGLDRAADRRHRLPGAVDRGPRRRPPIIPRSTSRRARRASSSSAARR